MVNGRLDPTLPAHFDVTPADRALLRLVTARGMTLARDLELRHWDRFAVSMYLTLCHVNGCPLRLQAMLDGDDYNLMHDVIGIMNNFDTETGKLGNGFEPRYAA